MSVRNHRIAALAILAVGVMGLLGWGRSMALESSGVRAERSRFAGHWVATSVRLGDHLKAEGAEASKCSAAFDGKLAEFRGLVGGVDARGTFYVESAHPGWIDLKLDEGWIIGMYQFEGDELVLCLNPLAPPERLGVPTLGRPRDLAPGRGRASYRFRRAG